MGKIIRFGKRAVGIVAKPQAPTVKQSVAAFSADEHGKYVFVNSHWSKLTGLSQADALGRGWLASVHPEDREEVSRAWTDAIRGERYFGLTFRLNQPEMGICSVLIQAIPQHNEDGDLSGYGGTIIDTSQFSGRPFDSNANRHFQAILDLFNLCYYEHDLVTGEVFLSPSCLELIGIAHTVQEFDALVHPEDLPRLNALFSQAVAEGRLFEVEYRIAARSNDWIRIKDFAKIIRGDDGLALAAVGFIAPVEAFLGSKAEGMSLLCRLMI